MTTSFLNSLERKAKRAVSFVAMMAVTAGAAVAQGPQARVKGAVENGVRAAIVGSKPARALPANDAGAIDGATRITGASIVFNRSAAQQAALEALLAAQQDPSSPQYHQWLSPDEFAAQFGMTDADLAKVRTWLESQGLTVDATPRGRDRLLFRERRRRLERRFRRSCTVIRRRARCRPISLPRTI